jgi:PAS domain S-box-containing protein
MSAQINQLDQVSVLDHALARIAELEAALNLLEISVCAWLPDTTLTFANTKYKALFGLEGDVQAQKWIEFLPESSREATLRFCADSVVNPRVVHYEHPVTAHDGRVHEYHWVDTPILDAAGQVVRFLSAGIDISARKRTEQLIAAQRDLARLIAQDLDETTAWAACIESALQVSGLDSGGLYLFNMDHRAFELVYHQGLHVDFVQAVAVFGEDTPNAQLVFQNQISILTAADLQAEALYRREGLCSVVVIPIQHAGQVVGCLNVASHQWPDIPAYAQAALQTIAVEIGNLLIHQQTKAALRRRSAQLSETLITAHMGTWRYHIATERITWSPEAAQLIGAA